MEDAIILQECLSNLFNQKALALWGGNRKEVGKLKSLITEKNKVIEGKGKDAILVPNFTHLILSSNEDWPVHLDPDDRRFFVLKVSNQHKEDKAYFKAIHDELEKGGINALLYELLNEDITHFDPRNIPQNIEAFEIKLLSASSSERYIYEALNAGCFDIGNASTTETWKQTVHKSSIFGDYRAWCVIQGIAQQDNGILGRSISRLVPSAGKERPRVGGDRIQCYVFPELSRAREEFQKAFKADSTIWD